MTAGKKTLSEMQVHLVQAAKALLALEGECGGEAMEWFSTEDEDFEGAAALMKFLSEKRTKIPAPVEAQAAAKALLGALFAVDELGEAIEMSEG